MIQLIIVDDEKLEIEGIKAAVDFNKLGVTTVFEASNMRQAKEVFSRQPIDIMLCDIEMPQGSGLELLAWVRENYPKTECIFITCHADFSYAKQAIQLGSLDYILKPAQPAELEKVILKAIDNIHKASEIVEHKHFSRLWFKHQPLLIERFWLDILNHKITSTHTAIKKAALEIDFPMLEEMKVLPVLVQAQCWPTELDSRDEKTMEFALKNVACELILKDQCNGIIIELGKGGLLGLIYLEDSENLDFGQVKEDCDSYVSACRQYLGCDLSCYIGEKIYPHELVDMVNQLLLMDKNNVAHTNKVFLLNCQKAASSAVSLPDMNSWAVMLEQGEKDRMLSEVKAFVQSMVNTAELNVHVLHQIQQDFMQMMYTYLKGKGILAHQLFSDDQSIELFNQATRSIMNMTKWMVHSVEKAVEYVSEVEKSQSVIGKVRSYIARHIEKELTCEEIANHVYLNPIYLNRIFKRETGLSISEYLQKERLKIARELLSKTNMPVSTVASHIGYTNFSHFSRMFRKHTGLSPVDFRKKHFGKT